jgi:hypothetical protein
VRLDPAQAGEDRQNLADALRDLRKASGLSGDRLARRCGMSQSKVSRIEFLLTESAVRWQLCDPPIMALQIDRLVSLSWLSNVRLGVVPLTARLGDGAYHTFVTYDERLVTIELFTGQLVLRDPKDVAHYRHLFAFFGKHALWDDAARRFLAEIADAFRGSNLCEFVHGAGGPLTAAHSVVVWTRPHGTLPFQSMVTNTSTVLSRDDRTVSTGFDASVPNMARVYDYWLGGKDHYAADRGRSRAATVDNRTASQ